MEPFTPRPNGRVIARFSCGAASAVATKLAIEKYGDAVEIYYTDTGSEHPDNIRFIEDCEKWFGRKVNILRSERYQNIWEVFESRKFLVNHRGAPCTGELKRIPGDSVWRLGDIEVFGYTVEERRRVDRWQKMNNEKILWCPLVDAKMNKEDCFAHLAANGITLPLMYLLGFRNNNCIGCVKARDNINYWKRVRKFFPDVFNRMAALERKFNTTINRRQKKGVRYELYLDEIEEGDPKGADLSVSCGIFCMPADDGDYSWI